MTMTGVGYFTAMMVVSEVGDIGRFRGEKEFASWMGLAPSVRQSGEKTRMGGVSGPGNKSLLQGGGAPPSHTSTIRLYSLVRAETQLVNTNGINY